MNRAKSALNTLRNRGVQVGNVTERTYPDQSFAYFRFTGHTSGGSGVPSKLAVDGTGTVRSIYKMRKRYHTTYEKTWGEMAPTAARTYEGMPAGERKEFLLWYTDASALQRLENAVSTSVKATGSKPRVAVADLGRPTLARVAKLKGVNRVDLAEVNGVSIFQATPNTVASAYAGSDDTFNADGIYAQDVKVGILDDIQNDCAVWETHEAFSQADISYTHPPKSCNIDDDCHNDCNWSPGSHVAVCAPVSSGNDVCTAARSTNGGRPHPTWVMSRVSSTINGVPGHAAAVDFHVANGDPIGDGNVDEYIDYYEEFESEGVALTNESFGVWQDPCEFTFSGHDAVRDYFGRLGGFTIVKAAGNSIAHDLSYQTCLQNGHTDHEYWETNCHALNALCVGATRRLDDYDKYLADQMYAYSLYANPYPDDDAERPDVVSEGSNAWAARPESNTDWRTVNGTSFSAPVVTGLIALLRECRGSISPKMARAVIRNAAWQRQQLEMNDITYGSHSRSMASASDPFYPSPGMDGNSPRYPDSFAGTGIPVGGAVELYCPGNQDGPSTSSGEGDSDDPAQPTPDWALDEPVNAPNVIEVGDDEWNTIPQGLTARKTTTQSKRHKVLDLGTMDDHSRVRFSLSFYSCVPDGNIHSNYQSITDSEPALDFDAILVDAAEQEVLDVSNSFLDTNEGFDHYLEGGGEDVEVWVVFPPDSEDPTCYPNAPDSYAWAAVWW